MTHSGKSFTILRMHEKLRMFLFLNSSWHVGWKVLQILTRSVLHAAVKHVNYSLLLLFPNSIQLFGQFR